MLDIDPGEWENLELVSAAVLLNSIIPDAKRAVKDGLLLYEGTIKQKLTGTRSGRTYRVPETRARGAASRVHVASAPGEPPAVLFGNLRNSVGHDGPNVRLGGAMIEGEVGPGLGQEPEGDAPDPARAYARRLEFGGTDSRGVKIKARPYLEPSALEVEPKLDSLWRRRLGS